MTDPVARVILAAGREKSLRRRHPWVFSGAIRRVEGDPAAGDTVAVTAADRRVLGLAAWSPESRIPARIWTFDPKETVDADFFHRRVRSAWAAREGWMAGGDTCVRVIHAEADGLPGVVVDRYGDWLVCQLLSAGAERWREVIVEALMAGIPGIAGIYERSDAEVRGKEGLPPRAGGIHGTEPPPRIEILQGGARFLVDVRKGHKTGFYLDQRDNRARISPWFRDLRVLNVFSYTGAFAVDALRAGAAHVTNLDGSEDALAACEANLELNGLDAAAASQIRGDAFRVLREMADGGETFDAVILDPPKFADSRARVEGALRGYKDINLLGLRLLRPGGLLATFSCSGLVDTERFRRAVAWAAMDIGRDVQVLMDLAQAADHPVPLAFPEGSYLKGFLAQVP